MPQPTTKPSPISPSFLNQWLQHLQPASVEECRSAARPCPHLACIHHLYLVDKERMILPNKEIMDLVHTCKLDLEEQEKTSSLNQDLVPST